jgi:Ca2+-binding EF-hand superfamily protein
MFERIDADHDGVASAAEIETAKDNAHKRRAKRLASLAKARAAMPMPSERFAELDQNHDGKITRDEFVSGRSWFDLLAKSPGGISKADFASFLDGTK